MAPTDQGVRERALDPGHSFVVQAPAGSGKTEVLTQRFLRLLALVDKPERVLAITFTRKATQEMRSRIVKRLSQARDGVQATSDHDQEAISLAAAVLRRDQDQQWNLLENPGRLRITTIDGLCVQLLSRDPVHGPTWSGVRVLETPDALYREAIHRMFDDIEQVSHTGVSDDSGAGDASLFARDALVRVLVRLGGDGRQLEKLMMDMLARRNLWMRHLDAGHEGFSALLEVRQQIAVSTFARALDEELLVEAMDLAGMLGLLRTSGHPAHSLSVSEQLLGCHEFADSLSTTQGVPLKPGSISSKRFPDMDATRDAELERLKEIFQLWHEREDAVSAFKPMVKWPPLEIESEDDGDDSLLDDMRSLLSLALYELGTVSAERGESDFTAVSDIAVASLGSDTNPGDTMLAEDGRIDHILMDEFQDTSFTQFRLLRGLTAGWEPDDGRTLFLVGDPMQSIYRFREANVGFFNDVVQNCRFGSVRVESLSLTSNFRSRKELIDWFNSSFPNIFPDQDESDSGAVSYTEVHAERGTGGRVGLHAFNVDDETDSQYKAVARLAKQKLEQSTDETIAVLVRSRTQIPQLTEALKLEGVDFDAVAMQPLKTRPVVSDLLAITRALFHPMDRIAWLALLRAPWCGFSVAEIHEVTGNNPADPILARIREPFNAAGLAPASRKRLDHLAEVMDHAWRLAPIQPLGRLVEMCWIQLGGPLSCSHPSDIEDAQVFLDLLKEVEGTAQGDIGEVVQEAMEKRFAASRPAPVQVMTIHNAKGLQFDTVIVPDLARKTRGGSQPLIQLQEFSTGSERDGVLMAPFTPSYVSEISLYRYLGKVDEERDRYEAMRLLYVACTRAKNELHLLASVSLKKSGEPTIPTGSFLGFMSGLFEPAMAALEVS